MWCCERDHVQKQVLPCRARRSSVNLERILITLVWIFFHTKQHFFVIDSPPWLEEAQVQQASMPR
jgi:hypothetical protein